MKGYSPNRAAFHLVFTWEMLELKWLSSTHLLYEVQHHILHVKLSNNHQQTIKSLQISKEKTWVSTGRKNSSWNIEKHRVMWSKLSNNLVPNQTALGVLIYFACGRRHFTNFGNRNLYETNTTKHDIFKISVIYLFTFCYKQVTTTYILTGYEEKERKKRIAWVVRLLFMYILYAVALLL